MRSRPSWPIGSFLLSAFLVPPQDNGVLDASGYRALRMGTVASGVWAVCAALLVPLTVSDITGQPLTSRLSPSAIWSVASLIDTAGTWRWTALLAAIVTVLSIPVLRWSWTPVLFGGALLTLLPLALTGHSSAGGSHDLATNSLIIHLVAGAVWAGGLLALLAHAVRSGSGDHADLAARRFSAVALWCFVAMALSGVVNALVRVKPGDLVHSGYGWLVICKAVALCTLGVIGWQQRRRGVAALAADPEARRPLIRLALVEAVVFGLTFGIAVALGRTPPPPPPIFNPSIPAVEIGYDFAGPPTVARILFDWRFDLVFGTAAIIFAVLYLLGVRRLRRRGDAWPAGRIVAWLCGCAVLLFATSSGIGRYMPAMFSMHMAAHMMLSMLAPVLLVLGAPVTLALRALPAAGRSGSARPAGMAAGGTAQPGVEVPHQPDRRHGAVHRGLLRPVLRRHLRRGGEQPRRTPRDEPALPAHRLPLLLGGHRGRPDASADPAAGEAGSGVRLTAVARVLRRAADGQRDVVLAGSFYESLKLYWHTDLIGDQRLGGGIAWAAGEVPLVLVLIALLGQWRRSDQRDAKRLDRAADRDDDADLAAYNAMLAKMADRDSEAR